MKFKIIGDSCCDLTKDQLNKGYFFSVPLALTVGGADIVDDEKLDVKKLLDKIAECPTSPKSSCPSPEAFMQYFDDAEQVFVVTISSKLSGSYNSAVLAKQIYMEDHPDAKIHIVDSQSAAAGEHIICVKLEELCKSGLAFEKIVEKIDNYVATAKTVFVLEDLDTMRKNGRLSKVKSVVANVLNIKPVLIGIDGEIHQYDQARGMNKALNKLLWYIEKLEDCDKSRPVYISQCESRERCMNVRRLLIEKFGFKSVHVIDAHGLSAMYMNRGGVVLAF